MAKEGADLIDGLNIKNVQDGSRMVTGFVLVSVSGPTKGMLVNEQQQYIKEHILDHEHGFVWDTREKVVKVALAIWGRDWKKYARVGTFQMSLRIQPAPAESPEAEDDDLDTVDLSEDLDAPPEEEPGRDEALAAKLAADRKPSMKGRIQEAKEDFAKLTTKSQGLTYDQAVVAPMTEETRQAVDRIMRKMVVPRKASSMSRKDFG